MKTLYRLLSLNLGLFGLPGCTADPTNIGRDTSMLGGAASEFGGNSATGGKMSLGGAASEHGGTSVAAGASSLGGASNAMGGVSAVGGANNACRVTEMGPGPFATKLRFSNTGTSPLWLWEGCRLEFDVTSCDDGYAAPLPIGWFCMQECVTGAKPQCLACGACFSGGKIVPPGGSVDYDWAGLTLSVEQPGAACSCYRKESARAGLYRVSIPVWVADPSTNSSTNRPEPTYRVTKDFELAETGVTTTIDLNAPVCTVGADQTCNDLLTVSALWGKCLADGTCQCNEGFVVNPNTGRCARPTLD